MRQFVGVSAMYELPPLAAARTGSVVCVVILQRQPERVPDRLRDVDLVTRTE